MPLTPEEKKQLDDLSAKAGKAASDFAEAIKGSTIASVKAGVRMLKTTFEELEKSLDKVPDETDEKKDKK